MAAGRLSTHVLDTAAGRPAAGLAIDLYSIGPDGAASLVRSVTTDEDGRAEGPLLAGDTMRAGRYELRFHAGDYHRASGVPLPAVPFLDVVTIAFGIASADEHYHVPLLLSPYGYSTYRGS